MMASAAQYRVEHLAKKPAGWRVRSVTRDHHVARIAFPKWPRRRGAGKLLEILHPMGESNPHCEISQLARKNPSELLMFTNPDDYESRVRKLEAEGLTRSDAQSVVDLEDMRAAEKAAEKKKKTGKKRNPIDAGDLRELTKLWHTARIPLSGSASRYQRLTWAAKEWEKTHPGQRLAAYKALDRETRGYGNPTTQEKKRAARERAKRIRAARLNPDMYEVVEVSASGTPTVMTKPLPRGQAKKFLLEMREVSRRGETGAHHFMRRTGKSNPRHKTIPQLMKECDQLKKALRYRMGNPKRAELKKKLAKIEAQFYPAMDRLAAARRAGGVMSPEYMAIEKETDKLGRELDSLRRQHAAAFNPTKAERVAAYRQALTFAKKGDLAGAQPFIDKMQPPISSSEFQNLIRAASAKRNPSELQQAVNLYETFHGRDARAITEKHESAAMRLDYTALGSLDYLKLRTPLGQIVQFTFAGDGVKLASSPDGKQLYLIGGNQNLERLIDPDSLQKDFIDLGEGTEVQYTARKLHGNFEPIGYYHKFGEKTGDRPRLMYDKLKRRIFFVGGNYFIDTTKAVSPGIEN
jgi:hypothetical protein